MTGRGLTLPVKRAAALLIAAALALSLRPFLAAQHLVHDNLTFLEGLQQHAEILQDNATTAATLEEQLRSFMQSSDLLQSAYAANSLLGNSPRLGELIDLMQQYSTLYEEVLSDVSSYQSMGLVSASQIQNSAYILTSGLSAVTEGIEYICGDVFKMKGMSTEGRLNVIKEFQDRLREETDKLLTFRRKMLNGPARDSVLTEASHTVNAILSPVPTLGPVASRTTDVSSANDAVVSDPVIRGIIASAENYDTGTTLSDVETRGRSLYGTALNITTYLIAIVAALFFAINYGRSRKGERQASDALYKVFYGLLFAVTALQIVYRVFMV